MTARTLLEGMSFDDIHLERYFEEVRRILNGHTSNENIHFEEGDIVFNIRVPTRVTGDYTVLITDENVFANTDGGDVAISLPSGTEGHTIRIVNTGTSNNTVSVSPDGSENLIGSNSAWTLLDGESVQLVYNATDGWY